MCLREEREVDLPPSELGKTLLLERTQKGLSQYQLAEKSGVRRSVIANLESGQVQSIWAVSWVALARALEIPAEKVTRDSDLGEEDGRHE